MRVRVVGSHGELVENQRLVPGVDAEGDSLRIAGRDRPSDTFGPNVYWEGSSLLVHAVDQHVSKGSLIEDVAQQARPVSVEPLARPLMATS